MRLVACETYFKMKIKLLIFILPLIIIGWISYQSSLRVKFYAHHGIWLPSFCNNFEFIETPDLFSFFGLDGHHTKSTFEIKNSEIQTLVNAIGPQEIWLKYSDLNPAMKDSTLHCPCILPNVVLEGKVQFMLWSSDTKGDYNIVMEISDGEVQHSLNI